MSRKDPTARGIRASHGLGDKINKHQLRNIDRTNTKTLNKWSILIIIFFLSLTRLKTERGWWHLRRTRSCHPLGYDSSKKGHRPPFSPSGWCGLVPLAPGGSHAAVAGMRTLVSTGTDVWESLAPQCRRALTTTQSALPQLIIPIATNGTCPQGTPWSLRRMTSLASE